MRSRSLPAGFGSVDFGVVVTGGGVLARITEVGENFVQVEIAEGVQIKVQKQSVGSLMPKGTFKGAL